MEYTEEDYKIAQILYNKMKTLPIGIEQSISELGMMALEETSEKSAMPICDDWWPVMDTYIIVEEDMTVRYSTPEEGEEIFDLKPVL